MSSWCEDDKLRRVTNHDDEFNLTSSFEKTAINTQVAYSRFA